LSGYRFLPLPINAAARDELGTTNLINGVYSNATTTVIGFFADWPAELGRQMNVIQHTPDMCWVGAGAVAVEMNSPRTIDLEFEGVRLPFECRVFRLPGRLTLEAAMWCTLISGRVYEEQARVTAETGSESDSYQRSLAAHRRRGFGTFRQVLRDRIPGTSSKQFARFSTEIRGSTDAAFEDLKRFGQTWLKLQVEEGSPKAGGGQREWKALD
jgi:hypothetical protein